MKEIVSAPYLNNATAEAAEQVYRILIVDDELSMLQLIKSTLQPSCLCQEIQDLQQTNYLCEEVLSAEDALGLLENDGPFDLLICDYKLGGMTGIELLRRVRIKYKSMATILMSSLQDMDVVVDALRARADDYLKKPFDLTELVSSVERVFERRRHPTASREALTEHGWNSASRALAMALNTKDHETDGHASRVVQFSLRLGREMSLDPKNMLALKLGSRLHDIGKIGVPDHILRKPGKLTPEEREQMSCHPLIGQELLMRLELPESAARVVGQHHEKWDGTGYPACLVGEQIDLPARIFSVIDAFDAIISDRVYRKGRSYEEASLELQDHSGTQFDPQVIAAFLRVPKTDWEDLRKACLADDRKLATL